MNEENYRKKFETMRQSISDFMNDGDITDEEKKISALSMVMFLVYKSAFNVDEAMDMFAFAEEKYAEDDERRNGIHQN